MLVELIKKDVVFAKKWFAIGGALMLMFAFTTLSGDAEPSLITIMMFFLFLGVVISRICQTEDSAEVKIFLKSMPVRPNQIVLARYVILFALLALMAGLLAAFNAMQGITILILGFFALYFSFYLFLFYFKGYYATRYANTVFVAFFAFTMFNANRGLGLNGFELYVQPHEAAVALAVIAALIGLCVYGSIWAFERR